MRRATAAIFLLASLSPADVDIGVVQILLPPSSVDTGAIITPEARWHNFGSESTGFTARCALIREPDSLAYMESVHVALLVPGADIVLQFPDYQVGHEESDWRARFWSRAPDDTNRANDALEKPFRVRRRGSI